MSLSIPRPLLSVASLLLLGSVAGCLAPEEADSAISTDELTEEGRAGGDEARVGDTVATNERSSCAITPDGGVKCWGTGLNLGDGRVLVWQPNGGWDRPSAVPVSVIDLPGRVRSITGNSRPPCVLTEEGAVRCWQAWFDLPSKPIEVGIEHDAVELASTQSHTCAVLKNGDVMCRGQNYFGQFGPGRRKDYFEQAVKVNGVPPARSIAVVSNGSCIMTAEGEAWCLGSSERERNVPVKLPPKTVAISLLGRALYALTEDGKVFSSRWGFDGYVYHDGSWKEHPELQGAKRLSNGGSRMCAYFREGAKCWGTFNTATPYVGDGTPEASDEIAGARLLPGVTSVGLGGMDHTCARTDDGKVRCWGGNDTGQLGNGTTEASVTPVDVNL